MEPDRLHPKDPSLLARQADPSRLGSSRTPMVPA